LGINRLDLALLIELRQRQHIPLNPYVVELGAQQLSNEFLRSDDLVRKAEAAFGATRPYALPTPGASTTSAEHVELLDSEAPFARDFWLALGFDYTAIDVDGSPGSIPLDLNYDQVPSSLRGKFGLVTNLGTTEHVANQMNAFKVVHDLAAPGAVMIHHLPAGGMLNHGLFNYNPKFFWHLARSNDYKWLYMNFYGSGYGYPIAANILDFTKSYAPDASEALRQREMSDYAIQVAFQKTLDIPFVAPIDVNTGTTSNDPELNRRYWTVLQPGVLDAARRSKRPHEFGALLTPDDATAVRDGATRQAIEHSVADSEERTRALIDIKVGQASSAIHDALRQVPDRRYIAFVAVLSAIVTAVVLAALVLGARLLL
jgi:hypothetical protein